MEDKDEVVKTETDLSEITEKISDSTAEKVSPHQNEAFSEVTSSEVDCDSNKVDNETNSDKNHEDQSIEENKMKANAIWCMIYVYA